MPNIIINGKQVKFTCENRKFKTNVNKGNKGSVTKKPLHDDGVFTMRLEHVIEKKNNNECFWFMWYKNGRPLLTMSSVFEKEDLFQIIENLKEINI